MYIKTVKDNLLLSGNYSGSFNVPVFNKVPFNKTCLDVGCWDGNLGEKLVSHKKCVVDGIDVNEEMLNKAKTRGYRSVYPINLNLDTLDFSSIKESYDVIIFADILEHLINPVNVLRLLSEKLNKDGMIIISLPNVAFLLNRLNLLLGKWQYKEFGTLDKTHLKFFTLKTGREMVESVGLKVLDVIPYNQFGILKKIHPLEEIFPELLAYQFMVVATKDEK